MITVNEQQCSGGRVQGNNERVVQVLSNAQGLSDPRIRISRERISFVFWVCAIACAGYAVLQWFQGQPTPAALGNLALGAAFVGLRAWTLAAEDDRRVPSTLTLTAGLGVLAITWNGAFTGGIYAPSFWFYPCMSVLVALLVSTRQALLWTLVCMSLILLFLGLHMNGLLPTPESPVPVTMLAVSQMILLFILSGYAVIARRANDQQVKVIRDAYDALLEQKRLLDQHSEQLNASLRDAEQARRRADEASAAKSGFLSTMSHEIRTPLNGIIGLNSLLLELPLPERAREYAELARQSGESLLALMNDFLDFSKIEAGQLDLVAHPFEPASMLRDLVAIVGANAERKRLRVRLEHSLPDNLEGDSGRLRQVLLNLLGNAIKFTEQGEVRLRALTLASTDVQHRVRFEVTDTGIGIDPDKGAQLFQPFVQADASISRRYGGTGLGLAICQSLVNSMGGEIGYTSRPGQGSEFWVELPLGVADSAEATPWDDAEKTVSLPAARMLVVEDNSVNQLVTSRMLANVGMQVDVVADGVLAVEALRDRDYDLVLMDCHMPFMDGFAAAEVIRLEEQRRGKPPVPIIAITASAMSGDRERCLAAGMDDYLAKPVRRGELEKMLHKWLVVGDRS